MADFILIFNILAFILVVGSALLAIILPIICKLEGIPVRCGFSMVAEDARYCIRRVFHL